MDRQLLSRLLIAAGVLSMLAGAALTVLDPGGDGDGDEVAQAAPDEPAIASTTPSSTTTSTTSTTTSTTTTSTTTSSSTTTTTTTTTTAASTGDETVEEFLAVLDAGLASDDIAGALLDRLHQATIDRYGEATCRTYLEGLPPQEPGLRIREVGEPAPWRYETDGIALTIAEAVAVEVDRVVNGETIIQELHWSPVEGRFEWFTDCGEPAALG